MLGTSWECHKVREFALRPMGDFLLVLDQMVHLKSSGNDKILCILKWCVAQYLYI